MARETVVKITSDLTGTVYEGADVPKVKITVAGKSGTIDLTPEEADALTALAETGDGSGLRKLLADAFTPATATAASTAKRSKSKSKSGNRSAEENTAIREWSRSPEGVRAGETAEASPMNERGRIPAAWAELYDAAHAANPAA